MINNPFSVSFSNTMLRLFADRLAQLYDLSTIISNYWNANGGSGITNATTAPTGVAATGGSFTAATYSWKYTWLNAKGETLASSNFTLAVTASQKVTLTIPALPAGATSANVYRGTVVGSEGLVGNTATTSFVDLGSVTPGVVASTSNTTGLIPNDSELIVDGSATDGRPPVTGIAAVTLVNRVIDVKNFCEGSVPVSTNDGSKTILGTVLAYAVNVKSS